MKSYVEDKPGYESIELLEDCDLYRMETESLRKLFNEDIHIANWGRKLAEAEMIKSEELIISRQFKTSLERYKDIMAYQPELLKRVQLGYIASYLGITQVSLSRIRAEIK
jgi:CRP-like cAMP-binding protein